MMQAAKDSIDLGIICRDIHASLHFYQDLLGLTNVGITPGTIMAMVKDPDGNIVEIVERS